MVAEDDPGLRELLASSFRRDGWEVAEAATGGELEEVLGWQLLRPDLRRPVDIVVSDQRMPIRSGLDALRDLRRAGDATPFVFITAFGDRAFHEAAAAAGVAAVFDKPFDVNDLRAAVRTLARRPTA